MNRFAIIKDISPIRIAMSAEIKQNSATINQNPKPNNGNANWLAASVFVLLGIVYLFNKNRIRRINYRCNTCDFIGPAKEQTKGHILIEIILWLCFLVPGLIYSIWRRTGDLRSCANCGSKTLFPYSGNTSVISKIESELQNKREERECPFCAEKILAKAKVCKHCGKEVK